MQNYEMVATTLMGLENILANEIKQLGGQEIEILKRAIKFNGDDKILYASNLGLRTALRILVPLDEFFAYVKKEDEKLLFNEKDYKTSENSIKLRMKAMLAQDLWGISEYFQIANAENEILQAAIKTIESENYDKKGLAQQ